MNIIFFRCFFVKAVDHWSSALVHAQWPYSSALYICSLWRRWMAAALSAPEAWLCGLGGGQRGAWWAGRGILLEGKPQLAWSAAGGPGRPPPPGTPPQAVRSRQGQAGGAPAAQWQLSSPQGNLVPGQVPQRGTQRRQGRQAEVCGRGLCE